VVVSGFAHIVVAWIADHAISVIHRADYHTVLLDEALRLGADLRKNSEVVDGNFSPPNPYVLLQTGEKVEGDVIIGADGRHLDLHFGSELTSV
jgi:2-polyprenyl-6-methoxyphenol hydroxylase-like FAD-dependent oxidoreductase